MDEMDRDGKKVTEAELLELLARKYPSEQWAFFTHVPSTTGMGSAVRRADALAIGLWPSRGLELHGFEVKTNRADWLKELKDPEKAEQVCRYCDRWWIVVSDKEIVREGELPPTWGLMVKHGKQLRKQVKAPKIKAEPMDRAFVAVLLQRACRDDQTPEEQQAAIDAAYEKGRERERELGEHWKQESKRLEEKIREFEETSGVNIQWWAGGEVGKAMRLVLNGTAHLMRDGQQMLRALENMKLIISEGLTELEKLEEARNSRKDAKTRREKDEGTKTGSHIPESDQGESRAAAAQ